MTPARSGFKHIGLIVLAVIGVISIVVTVFGAGILMVALVARSAGGHPRTVAVIHVDGVISEDPSAPGLLGGGGGTSAREFNLLVKEAADDSDIGAVVVRINSPGGGVVASAEMYRALSELRTKSHKHVVVSMGDEAASGGYYISCAADRVVANPNTITGSIGVIMHLMYLQGLYDKIGVKEDVIKSGPHKDIGSRPLTPDERKILQNLIDDAYGGFLQVVADRPGSSWHGNVDEVRPIADGSVYSGKAALAKGLVDELGDLQEAEKDAARLAGIQGTPNVVVLQNRTSLLGTVTNRLGIDPTKVQVSLTQLGPSGPGYAMEYLALPPGD